jgi:hypothetical protein
LEDKNMHVAWTFLDKRSAAVNAIRAFKDMELIIEETPENLCEQQRLMVSPKSVKFSEMPGSPNPKGGEQRIAAMIDGIDVMKERYRQALEFMEWYKPAFDALTDTERTILTEMYQSATLRSGAISRLEKQLGYGHSQIDRLRSKALMRLAQLLYGV